MFDILKQSVYASVGLANVTKEKVADLVAEVTKEGELTGRIAILEKKIAEKS